MHILYVYHVHVCTFNISLAVLHPGPDLEIHTCICMYYVRLYIMYVNVVSLLQSNTQDQILLQWEGGDSATMHVLVVHAMIILLTYGPPNGKCMYDVIVVFEKNADIQEKGLVLFLH